MKKRIRLIGLVCWLSSMIVFVGLAVWMNKIGDRLPMYQTLAGIWLGDILFGTVAFLVFIASFASSGKKIESKVPHAKNKSRLGRTLLLVSIGLVLLMIIGVILATSLINRNNTQVSNPSVVQINADKLMEIINSWETSQGYKPYVVDDTLCAIASKRVSELTNSFESAINLQGYDEGGKNFSNMAESITKDFSTEQSILDVWVNNPVTKKNLTDYFVNSCVRCENTICVQILGNKKGSVNLSKQSGSTNTTVNPAVDALEWGKTVKVDDITSRTRFAHDNHMSTVDELNIAMNLYRQSHNLSTLKFDSLLCQIAQKRVDQFLKSGEMDRHEGFKPLFDEQDSFPLMVEVLFSGNGPTSGIHIVEWGWDQSVTGHHDAISDPKWTEGCGGVAGYFAAFVFGKR